MKPKVYVTRHVPEAAREELEAVCEVTIWDEEYSPPYKVILENIADKEGLVCLLTDRIDANLMDAAPHLKVISQVAVGFDNIDVAAASERGIAVGNTPGVLTDATADFAFALLMSAARRIGEAYNYVLDGKWETWGLTSFLGQEVFGATLGIIGMGRIGRAVAQRARGFGMKVLYHGHARQPDAEAVRQIGELLRQSAKRGRRVNRFPRPIQRPAVEIDAIDPHPPRRQSQIEQRHGDRVSLLARTAARGQHAVRSGRPFQDSVL